MDAVTSIISTVAGSPANRSGFSGDGGSATGAFLNHPTCLALDSAGNLYVCDSWNFRVRRIDAATGIITTVAGNGVQGYGGDGGPATNASMNYVYALAVDPQGNLFIGDWVNYRVRRVDALTGIITTVAGNGSSAPGADGIPATSSPINEPWGVAVDSSRNLFISERYNSRLRVVAAGTGIITTIAGTGVHGFSGDGGPPLSATFWEPSGLLVDAARNVFVCDTNNHRVRKFPVPNLPPTANAGPDQIIEASGATTSVTLNGSGSSDPDGDTLSFEWRDASNAVVGSTAVITLSLPLGTQTFTLTVTDPSGASSFDAVNITVRDTTPPAVTVTSPNGGEKLFTGTAYTIQWNASDAVGISSFDVYFSTNGGSNYSPVPGCIGAPGTARSCTWVAPGPATSQGRIRVTAVDGSNNSTQDASDVNYSVVSGTASITVTQPNTVVNWNIGTTQQIKWNHNLGLSSYVRIELSRDVGTTWELLAASVKNNASTSGAFSWVVTGPATAQGRIRVTWTGGPASDLSDVNFNIPTPYITVASPSSSSANWGYGSLRSPTWSTNLGAGERVNVLLSADGGATFPIVLASNIVASNKTATITTPTLAVPTAAARIRVEWAANPSVQGTNPVNFKIQPPFVTVSNPNSASHVWTIDSTKSISWTHNLGDREAVLIELSLDGGTTYPIVLFSSTPCDGSQSVTVQSAWATQQGRVRITWTRNAAVTDVSNQNFPIQ
ncbi:MAG: hypothetical protein HY234_13070 [Acidobacteria bacterium]|nr:hypothetical protein [Acidobacteriota bacterium]